MPMLKKQQTLLQNKTPDHQEKVTKTVQEITTKHLKLLQELAE